ncbi:MAG: ZIP family metal transporter [Candidatus Paceibacterota bacterium]|jgi:ZIP family zinc transporter
MIIIIAIATFFSTLIGGLVALHLKDKLHLVIGFSAGAVIGVAFFDLIPESIELGSKFYEVGTVTSIIALGFIIYLVLDRLIFLHIHEHAEGEAEVHEYRGILGAGSLATHSFMDGVAIGLAFQVSTSVGAIVAVAVLVHDFSDGINTVGMILKNKGERKIALKWLFVDALAPVLGVISTLFFTLPERSFGIVLALFSGFFLYIGASDLIPESHHAHPKFLTTAMTILGVGVLYVAIRLAGI